MGYLEEFLWTIREKKLTKRLVLCCLSTLIKYNYKTYCKMKSDSTRGWVNSEILMLTAAIFVNF